MKPKLLLWLIIILVLITIVGWVVFYIYQRFNSPNPVPSPLATVLSRSKAEQIAFDKCLDPSSKPEAEAMEKLISQVTDQYHWRYDDDFTEKMCLISFKGTEIIGELYFVMASPNGKMGVETVKWQSAP